MLLSIFLMLEIFLDFILVIKCEKKVNFFLKFSIVFVDLLLAVKPTKTSPTAFVMP